MISTYAQSLPVLFCNILFLLTAFHFPFVFAPPLCSASNLWPHILLFSSCQISFKNCNLPLCFVFFFWNFSTCTIACSRALVFFLLFFPLTIYVLFMFEVSSTTANTHVVRSPSNHHSCCSFASATVFFKVFSWMWSFCFSTLTRRQRVKNRTN